MASQDIDKFVKERNEALLSMDEQKIRSMFRKWNYGKDLPDQPEAFWGAVHKSITGSTYLPIEFRHKSKLWLRKRGWTTLDDGDLHTSACCKELATIRTVAGRSGMFRGYKCSKCGEACDLLA